MWDCIINKNKGVIMSDWDAHRLKSWGDCWHCHSLLVIMKNKFNPGVRCHSHMVITCCLNIDFQYCVIFRRNREIFLFVICYCVIFPGNKSNYLFIYCDINWVFQIRNLKFLSNLIYYQGEHCEMIN